MSRGGRPNEACPARRPAAPPRAHPRRPGPGAPVHGHLGRQEVLGFVNGYDTAVGIGGVGVSGGQAQRINIARALLKNPPVLLLDEATASLDSLSEMVVQDALDQLMAGRTTFVVAHHLSTLRGADRILVLQHGAAVGLGPHDTLLASCPLYQEMWDLQRMDSVARVAAGG